MIRVGLFIDTYFPMVDGVINVVHNYAKRLKDDEFDVCVFCPKTQDKKYKDEFTYTVHRCKSVKIFFLDYCLPLPKLDKKFKKAIKDSQLDIVHIHSPFGVARLGIKYAKKHHIPVIATLHSQFKQDLYRSTHSRLLTSILLKYIMGAFNKCDEYYAVNERVAEIFQEYGTKHLPPVLKNGTDFTSVEDQEEACKLVNKTYNIANDVPVFLFVGRINKLKNIYFLAEALSLLKTDNYKMFFVGEGQDYEGFVHKIQQLNLTDKVIFTGRVTDRELLKAIYCRAKLFLFPSLYDASSLVQIEAASQGTPSVFIEGAATAATVTDNVNGFIAKPTPAAYAAKIEEILNDENFYAKVSEGAKRDLYVTWDETVANLKEIYKNMIQKVS